MWVVRSSYFNSGAFAVSYSRIFDNVFFARAYASEKLRILNSHWCVEVCKINVVSVECVGRK